MQEQGRDCKPIVPRDRRLSQEAERLRKEAQNTRAGVRRDALLRRALQAETTARTSDSLNSAGLKPPT